MGRLFKYLFYLAVLAAIAVGAFALFSDLPAPQSEVTVPVPIPDEKND